MQKSHGKYTLEHSDHGSFTIEIDWQYIKQQKTDNLSQNTLGQPIKKIIKASAEKVVPLEIVCPPLNITQLDVVSEIIKLLKSHGAKGTNHSVFAAYALQLNIELTNIKTSIILNYLKAFGILQHYLAQQDHICLSRKLSSYIQLFSNDYLQALFEVESSSLTMKELMDFHYTFNPTRNRALDLWPLFMHLDEKWVESHLNDERIKARPAFHFRLPNCKIDQPNWSLQQPWKLWYLVEKLAHDTPSLNSLIQQYKKYHPPLLSRLYRKKWLGVLDQWAQKNT